MLFFVKGFCSVIRREMVRNEWINSYLEVIFDVGISNKKRFESNFKIV